MTYRYALDLRVARRKAGLTQADCGHLLGVDPSRISKLEAGKTMPNIVELSILCLTFDSPPGALVNAIIADEARTLQRRLSSMPDCPANWRDRYNRLHTLNALAERLQEISPNEL